MRWNRAQKKTRSGTHATSSARFRACIVRAAAEPAHLVDSGRILAAQSAARTRRDVCVRPVVNANAPRRRFVFAVSCPAAGPRRHALVGGFTRALRAEYRTSSLPKGHVGIRLFQRRVGPARRVAVVRGMVAATATAGIPADLVARTVRHQNVVDRNVVLDNHRDEKTQRYYSNARAVHNAVCLGDDRLIR